MIVLIDNYDSFTFNLVHYLGELGAPVRVHRHDKVSAAAVVGADPDAIVLSPGPCTPKEAGICLDLIAALNISAEVEARGSAPGVKGDRADARPLASDCSAHAWPYFEAACLRDTRNPFGQVRDVRLVSVDRPAAAKAVKPVR